MERHDEEQERRRRAAEAEPDDGWTVVKRQKVLPLHWGPPHSPPSHTLSLRPTHPAFPCGRPAIRKRLACMGRGGKAAEECAVSASLEMGQGQQVRRLYIGLGVQELSAPIRPQFPDSLDTT